MKHQLGPSQGCTYTHVYTVVSKRICGAMGPRLQLLLILQESMYIRMYIHILWAVFNVCNRRTN